MATLNYRLLFVSICIVIGLVLYLFYWNRILGFIIGRIIRLLFWNQGESSIWVDVGELRYVPSPIHTQGTLRFHTSLHSRGKDFAERCRVSLQQSDDTRRQRTG